jgi:hypothetical protein
MSTFEIVRVVEEEEFWRWLALGVQAVVGLRQNLFEHLQLQHLEFECINNKLVGQLGYYWRSIFRGI